MVPGKGSEARLARQHRPSEGMKGARATTHGLWLAFQGESPEDICHVIASEYDYDLMQTVDDIRPDYAFNEICQETVPQAIISALESISFEDAIRNAISLGGDADTLAAIAGPIAEAIHGIPNELKAQVENRYLTGESDMLEIITEIYDLWKL